MQFYRVRTPTDFTSQCFLSGELVALLEYLGILSGISHEVLGMTVLAWGNSVGDLSTNSAMAKRGLSNMAMTACFAGPIINLLLSLGLGFMQNLGLNDVAASPVALQVGFHGPRQNIMHLYLSSCSIYYLHLLWYDYQLHLGLGLSTKLMTGMS